MQPENVVNELKKYTQISEKASQTSAQMANNEYYEMLEKYVKTFSSSEPVR